MSEFDKGYYIGFIVGIGTGIGALLFSWLLS